MLNEVNSLLRRDLVLGLHSLRYRLVFSFLIILVILISALYQLKMWAEIQSVPLSDLTYHDLLFTAFKGKEWIIGTQNIEFPFSWLFFYLLPPFIIGGYVREDLFFQSSFLVIRSKYRLSLIVSKLLFSLLIILIFYISVFLISLLLGASFLMTDSKWSPFALIEVVPLFSSNVSPNTLVSTMFILSFLVSLLLVTLQTVGTLILKPIYVLLILLSVLTISVFSRSIWLPGSISMIVRHEVFASINGFSSTFSIIYVFSMIILIIFIGIIVFKKIDIFPK